MNCSGKLADLFATDGVGALGGIDPAHNLRVNAHDFSLPFLCTVFSSNAQSGQTAVQVTGMQACGISSHFYLLAKAYLSSPSRRRLDGYLQSISEGEVMSSNVKFRCLT